MTLIVAQETDQTGRQITTMIVVLLVIAVLLALLTAWYWKHTDPRRRAMQQAEARRAAREVEEDRRAVAGEPAAVAVPHSTSHPAGSQVRHDPVWASEAVEQNGVAASDSGMSADEWLRLTGPAPRPSKQSTNGHNRAVNGDETVNGDKTRPIFERDVRPQPGLDGKQET